VVDGHGWHLGVIGIVASRIMDEVGRPVVVLTHKTDCVKGSARSFGSFNLFEALTHCREHLVAYGGHPNAAGMTLLAENVPTFRKAINTYALQDGSCDDMCPPLVIDAEVDCRMLDMQMMEHLRYLEPFGQSNPHPVLASRGVKLNAQPRVVGDKHLKMQFVREGVVVEGIGFNMGYLACELNQAVGAELDVVFSPSVNNYWSVPRVEMEVKDLRRTTI
jgi:single-stranded-DNA-specific exonuclease